MAATDLVTERYAHPPLAGRAWELRDHLTFHDALYVALAEATSMTLLTADERLARAPGARATIGVV